MYNNPFGFSYGNPMYYSSLSSVAPKVSLFTKLRNGFNWGNFLNSTSKTLNVINQAIPLYYQVKPLVKNASTLFKIADIIKSDDEDGHSKTDTNRMSHDSKKKTSYDQEVKRKEEVHSSSNPAFFI